MVREAGAVQRLEVTLSPEPNGEYERRARILGEVWAIKMLCGRLDGGFEALKFLYDPAIRHHRIRVFYNSLSDPIGYVVWAHLAPDVEARWMRDGAVRLHLSEWTEGDRLWIVDGMVAPGYAPQVFSEALQHLPLLGQSIRMAKPKLGRLVFKEIDFSVVGRFARSPEMCRTSPNA